MIAECSYTALDGFCRMTLDFKKKKQVKVETTFKWWKMRMRLHAEKQLCRCNVSFEIPNKEVYRWSEGVSLSLFLEKLYDKVPREEPWHCIRKLGEVCEAGAGQ